MLLSLFENIKQLTLTAGELIKSNQIEQCYIILAERQKILEQLSEQVSSHHGISEPKIKDDFIELLYWIQQQDQPNIIELEAKKQKTIEEFVKQSQTNKAIQQYKNV